MRAGILSLAIGVVGLAACSKAGTSTVDPPMQTSPAPSPAFAPAPPAPATKVTVQMTAATLADDCGGAAPASPPAPKTAMKREARSAKAKRKCEQSSMQLLVIAAGTATELRVKKVELFDESGASLGELTPRSPTVWSDASAYQPWDEKIAPAQELSVSYALGQPNWGAVSDRWNKTYVLKATLAVGGADQTVQQTVEVSAPTSLPPNVKT